jgi:molybdenum-dependent DNA-binding transcriptional regulator ModE
MGVTAKMWDAIATVIRMNDKVERLAGGVKAQQAKLENLTERLIRLETALEIALATQGIKPLPARQIEQKHQG